MGVSAGTYICEQLGDKPDAVIAEIAGIDSLPLTQDRSKGFADALADCGLKVSNRVSAEFTVESGEAAASNLLQAAPKIDALWNHDDDQGVGVMAAIKNAGRSEFIMVGGAGSANVMRDIQADNTVLKATVIYPSTQAADGIRLARLLVQGEALGDLVEVEVPREVKLYAPVVTKENVDAVPADRVRVLIRRVRTRREPDEEPVMTAAAAPALRVAMIGYAFMGAAHSQAWRTAGHVADLPLRPEMAVVVGRHADAVARRGATGWAGRRATSTGAG